MVPLPTCRVRPEWPTVPMVGARVSAHVIEVPDAALKRRRQELLDALHVSPEEFAQRAQSHALVGDEWEAWEELREIDFLLGDR